MAVGERKYKRPLTSAQKMRLMRLLVMWRKVILDASQEEGHTLEDDGQLQRQYVRTHQIAQSEIWDEFPFVDIRDDSYASDVLEMVMQDAIFYIFNGETPGGP